MERGLWLLAGYIKPRAKASSERQEPGFRNTLPFNILLMRLAFVLPWDHL